MLNRVIQGCFPGGRPRVLQASPVPAASVRPQVAAPAQARPVASPAPILPGRPTPGALQPALRPGQAPRPILPVKLQPGALQPAMPPRPQVSQPIVPRPSAVQPQAGNAFALPANFTLKPRGSGQPLPEPIQQKMESFFNTSFADVRIQFGHEAPSIGALAFTHGTDLYFAPGQYNPQSTHGQQLLGHELTHVVQQRAGRVRNPLGAGVAVVQDPALEAEAERMGLQAATTSAPVQANRVVPEVVSRSSGQPLKIAPLLRKTASDQANPGAINVSPPTKAGQDSYQIVAGSRGQPIGWVMVHARGDSTIEVTDLKVEPSHRGQGLGGTLMASALQAGRQLGRSRVVLASQDDGSGRLTRWYQRMGFEHAGSNSFGYPKLEASITRALAGAAQAKMCSGTRGRPHQNRQGPQPEIRSTPFLNPSATIQPMWAKIAAKQPPPPKQVVQQPVHQQINYTWNIIPSARNHYNDKPYWIDFDQIKDDEALKDMVWNGCDFDIDGETQRINLGQAKSTKNANDKDWHILFRCNWAGNFQCTFTIWHCGPNQNQSTQGLGNKF
jgi:ribosomal protein S18 acetylase RimI-like enzyme